MKAWRVTTLNHGGSTLPAQTHCLTLISYQFLFYAFSQKHKSKTPERTSTIKPITVWSLNVFTWYSCGISEGRTLQVCWNLSNERSSKLGQEQPFLPVTFLVWSISMILNTITKQWQHKRIKKRSVTCPFADLINSQFHNGAGRSQNALFFEITADSLLYSCETLYSFSISTAGKILWGIFWDLKGSGLKNFNIHCRQTGIGANFLKNLTRNLKKFNLKHLLCIKFKGEHFHHQAQAVCAI